VTVFLGRVWADFIGLFCVPLFIALCPARLGMSLSLRLAPHVSSYTQDEAPALSVAQSLAQVENVATWRSRRAFNLLRDHVDLYHWLIWGDYWYRHHVKVEGQWPAGAAVTVTYHWGGGLWGLYSLRQATGGFAGVAGPADWAALKHRPALYLYVRLRTWATHQLLGKGLVFPGNAARHLVRALKRGQAICGLYDSPPQAQDKILAVSVLKTNINLPRGLPALAVSQQVPLVTFSAQPDLETGGTRLAITSAVRFDNEQAAADHLAQELTVLVQREPAYWHHWYLCGL
jgi:hypothetical protein